MKGRWMYDQQIVQQYADKGCLNELPPRTYILTDIITISSAKESTTNERHTP